MEGSRNRLLALKTMISAVRRAAQLYVFNRSPHAFLQAIAFLARKVSGRFPPIIAYIAVTNCCQFKCPHCYSFIQNRLSSPELPTTELLKVLDQLKEMGTLQVLFTGGEPLLRKDIFDLIAHAHRIGMLTRMSTNGYLLDQACAAKLKSAGLDQCGVSIDQVDANGHDSFRGMPGSHARALQAFGYLRQYNIHRKMLVSTSHAKIASGLEPFVELGRELKVNSCFFTIPYLSGRWNESYQEVLSEEEMAYLRRLQKDSLVIIEFSTPQTNCCAYDKTVLSINPMGDVNPCPAVPFSLGNIRSKPLAAIWHRHVSALNLESRGKCPLNAPQERDKMKAHCDSVLSRK